MKADLQRLLKFPMEDPKWWQKVAIGVLCSLFVFFLGFAYLARVYKDALDGQPARLPEWDNWWDLALKGLIITAVAFFYGLAWFFVTAISFSLLTLIFEPAIVAGLAGMLATLIIIYTVPLLIARYLMTDNFKQALQPQELFALAKRALPSEYTRAFITVFLLQFALALVLNAVPVIGPIVWVFAAYYGGIVGFRMLGEAFPKELPQVDEE